MGDKDRNVGQIDRLIRVPFGMAAAVATIQVLLTYSLETAIVPATVLGISAVILLMTAVTGTCGIYGVLGINTCSEEDCVENGSKEAWVAE